MPSRYCYGHVIERKLLTYGHGSNNVDEGGFGSGFSFEQGARTGFQMRTSWSKNSRWRNGRNSVLTEDFGTKKYRR